MRLDDQSYEYIKEEVSNLLVHYDIRHLPISGFELAARMGIILIPYAALSTKKLAAAQRASPDGFYTELGDGKEYIYYNDQVRYERRNMTILHEIGHAVLGHTENMDSDLAEAEASFFAKYAAAPPPLVHIMQPTCPEELADIFRISFEASLNAWIYYQKWRRFHEAYGEFTPYEMRIKNLLRQSDCILMKGGDVH